MSSILNFNLEINRLPFSVVIDIENGQFYKDRRGIIYYSHPINDILSDYIVTDDGNGNLVYKGEFVGQITYPNLCSVNLRNLDVEVQIDET